MADHEKQVALSLDEMAIQPSLDYDCRSGRVLGLPTVADSANKESDNLATHALVFMLRGLSTPWRQAIAYEFTCNSWSSDHVKLLILKIIEECSTIGLDVKSITMDMGGGNQAILRDFGIAWSRTGEIVNTCPHPVNQSSKLHFFPDVPHLLKNLRNHLSRGQDIYIPAHIAIQNNLPSCIVTLNHVEALLNIETVHNLKLVPNLTFSHLHPGHFEKMKVKPAVVLLSRTTAAALRVLVERELICRTSLTTAWFFEQVSAWYDLMTSRSTKLALSNLIAEKSKNCDDFLADFISLIRNINIGEEIAPMKPVQRGMALSTASALNIKENLLVQNNFTFILMSGFTQDSLENLFSVVRYKNPVPTALEFKNALRVISLSQLLRNKKGGSYEMDNTVNLLDCSLKSSDGSAVLLDANVVPNVTTPAVKELSEVEELSLYNLAGYCLKKFIKCNKNCQLCVGMLVTNERPSVADFTVEKCYSVDALTFCLHSSI